MSDLNNINKNKVILYKKILHIKFQIFVVPLLKKKKEDDFCGPFFLFS